MALTSPQTEKLTGKIGDFSPLRPAGLFPRKEKGTVSLTLFCSAYAHVWFFVKWFHGDSPRITPQGTWADHCFVEYTIITALLQSSLGFILRLCRGLYHPFADGPRRPCLFSPCERGAVEVYYCHRETREALPVQFEWDEDKAALNLKKHGVRFETAARVFEDEDRIEFYDSAHSTEEDRYNTIGMVDSVLFVVYTERKNRVRLISARPANSKERRLYYDRYL